MSQPDTLQRLLDIRDHLMNEFELLRATMKQEKRKDFTPEEEVIFDAIVIASRAIRGPIRHLSTQPTV
ncbi:hypothetical protein K3U93_18545 [Mycobacterium malmoense]|uniref:hypothetical protein n=1 Tax=Mycobacterium malmoense TaxID=1780 RepID=UPI000924103F|nr:hypothetical protein [Mycobacterium malmoense]OIN82680.1 hypothetical protein BMG05_01070 [Mycobacterium malmoense]QZA16634.1 hypothetical protein K3U93_18545 [Mycobacterium malmoense]UNB93434.1 hypothetical protein H5T25_18530 [Mycobacterium malmoense]